MDTLKIKQNLLSFGLTEEEASILVVVAQHEDISVTEVSKETRIPRSSVYRYIDLLEESGLVTKVMSSQGNKIKLARFDILRANIEEEKQEILEREASLQGLIKTMLELKSQSEQGPSVKYFEGKQGVRQIIWNTLKSTEPIRCYTNAIRRDIVGSKWMNRYAFEFCMRDLSEKVLGDDEYAKKSYQKYANRTSYYEGNAEFVKRSDERVLTIPFLSIKGEIYLYDHVFAFYTWEGDMLIGSEIDSRFIAETQKSMFDVLWGMTSPDDTIDTYL